MAVELEKAEEHFVAEAFEDALAAAKAAGHSLGSSGNKEGAAKASYLQVQVQVAMDKQKEAFDNAKAELDTCRAGGDKMGEAAALLGMAAGSLGKDGARLNATKKEQAQKCATEAQALFGQLGNKKMEVEALLVLSRCLVERTGAEAKAGANDAVNFASRAREMCIEMRDKKLEGLSLHSMSQAHAAMEDLDVALQDADEALDIFLELKDKRMEAGEMLSMAQIHVKGGSFDRALSDAEDALELYQAVGSPKEVSAMGTIFQVYMMKNDTRRALRTAREGAKRFKKLNKKLPEGEALQMLVSAYAATGQVEEALGAAERALTIFQDYGYQQLEAKLSSVISGLHLRMARFDRALQHGEDASMLFREAGGDTTEKSDAMFNVVESHIQKKDYDSAFQTASEMRSHFQKEGDARGEAGALMTMCEVSTQMEKYDEAITSATRAQVILGEDGYQYGEATALRMLAEVLSKKGDHKQAVRAAERSRTIFRELGDKEGETQSLYVVGQEAIAMAVAEGARVGEASLPRAAADALSKAAKSADSSVKLARELPNAGGLLGSSLCVLAQMQMLSGKPEEALAAADEAVVLFREVDSAISEANALLLSADALRVTQKFKDAGEAAEEAMRLFQTLDPPDAKGESFAQEILDHLGEIKAQQQAAMEMKRQMAAGGGMANLPMMSSPAESGEMPAAAASRAHVERERGAALDMKGADMTAIRAKVLEIALRITGAEDGEIEADTPLMEAGLTSNSALVLRDELSQELPGVRLPVTLVFDYPSIGAMVELIAESSGKALK